MDNRLLRLICPLCRKRRRASVRRLRAVPVSGQAVNIDTSGDDAIVDAMPFSELPDDVRVSYGRMITETLETVKAEEGER